MSVTIKVLVETNLSLCENNSLTDFKIETEINLINPCLDVTCDLEIIINFLPQTLSKVL